MSSPASPPATQSEGDVERRKITGRAALVALGTLFSRFLGLGRDLVLAASFTRAATDAFLIAFQIPNLLRQLLAEGAVQNAVLPVLAKVEVEEGEAAAKSYFSAVRGLSLLILSVVTVLGMIFAEELVDAFTENYRKDPEQFARTVTLTRWVFPYIFFMGTTALGVAALNTHKRFTATSFSPALLNVSFIGFSLGMPGILVANGYDPILSMAFGALVGGLLQMLAQWPSLRAIGYLSPPTFRFGNPHVKESLRRMGPTLIGIGVYYVDVILGRRILSGLGEGPVSYFGFALRLCDFPQGIFVMALSTATLPSLAALVARRDNDELVRTFSYALRLAFFVGIPATLLFVTLAEPLVSLLFQHGKFDAEATRETGRALVAQGLGIFLVAGIRQLVSVFFALGDTRTPVVVAALDLIVFVGLAYGLRGPLGHVGVGLAVSGASLAQFALLYLFLKKRLPNLGGAEVLRSTAKTLAASVAGAVVAYGTVRWLGISPTSPAALRPLPALVGGSSFAITFLFAAKLLKSEELGAIMGPLRRRFARR